MKNRNYNIYFSTHTISGIIISAILFVIFFAGSYTLFKKDISAWQSNTSFRAREETKLNYNTLLDSLDQKHNLKGRDVSFFFQENTMDTYVSLTASKDSTLKSKKKPEADKKGAKIGRRGDGINFKYNFARGESKTYEESYDLGEFLYRLHFLAQLNKVPIRLGVPFGYMLAGLVSFFFLFALITGLLLHWDKIVSNFFIFRPWSKVKTAWTDSHTALGMIGFPYQLIYAITGIVLIFNAVLLTPFTYLMYDGKSQELYRDLDYFDEKEYTYGYQSLPGKIDIQSYINRTEKLWQGSYIKSVSIKNYGDTSMHLIMEGAADVERNFSGKGKIIYQLKDDKIVYQQSPLPESNYVNQVKSLIYRLHFGDYGGYALKIVYFILGIMGCVVIISGILVWLVARDKKNVPEHKRKFNLWLANIFLAICLSMFPVTALTFIAVKLGNPVDMDFIYHVFFYSWLVISAYYIIRKNISRTNRETLLMGSTVSFLIPIANGLTTGNWIWKTYAAGAVDILFVDILSLCIAAVGFICYYKIKQKQRSEEEITV
ncbi:PepSY-associated TM helix domain-containing protein [Pedobacter hartonius]|uniref:Uncharacterized iron-regulated membrane protein n=1 Tax=Pedobacter hartonius TaxID=425514 RepID=A0A1H4BKG3_9SPHI|nr:PepSY-associated TM helix domain-containing protein [Pedobacter hartonius]SEA48544.1 Uncharacterized iron-regulated membrane protein [Pedobacter hartonius]